MFRHDYPFDPTYSYDLDALLTVAPPDPPADFAAFWRALRARAEAVAVEPTLRELPTPQPHTQVFEIAFTSLDGMRIGGWLTRPRDEPVERGVVVGHGYGGREGPDFHLPFRRAALIFPCARGISRSARADIAPPEAIRLAVRRAFAGSAAGPLSGRKVVVTSGGTRERIDAVRFIGNRSSGKMGRAVADEAYLRGARVVLVTTQPAGAVPYGVVRVESADDMATAVREEVRDADVLVMAAAVADFKPRAEEAGKIRRGERETLTLDLVRTVDILAETARPGLFRVGFAAEAGPQLRRAREKKAAKGVDLLVFNDILAEGVGIGADENAITIITAREEIEVPRASKRACAVVIVDQLEAGLQRR